MEKKAECQFLVSIVMAVYNVQPFLREAIDSVLVQDIGFDKIQLILVDDGSTDGSALICDEYAQRHPHNIVVLHKENGGVSSARNAGLDYVQGKYVNFMDSDDKITPNTVSAVCSFFEKHEGEIDLVSFPMYFFDGQQGEHILNRKFRRGTRVVNLDKEYDLPQLSMSSAFATASSLEGIRFDTRLKYAEDAKVVLAVLMNRHKLGLVAEAGYLYRRRTTGEDSAIQSSISNKAWYLDYLNFFALETIESHKKCIGYVPLFVQYTLMYDLQWRIKCKIIPADVLSEQEETEYRSLLAEVLQSVSDTIIKSQRNIDWTYKLYALELKHGTSPSVEVLSDDVLIRFGSLVGAQVSDQWIYLDFFHFTGDGCEVEGHILEHLSMQDQLHVGMELDGRSIPCETIGAEDDACSMGKLLTKIKRFRGVVPLDRTIPVHTLKFFIFMGDCKIIGNPLMFTKFFPISREYSGSTYIANGWCMARNGEELRFDLKTPTTVVRKRLRQYADLWRANKPGSRKGVLVRLMVSALKPFVRRPIWVISDRVNRAGDNGEALFRYVRGQHSKEVKAYFVLNRDSVDYGTICTIGPVLQMGSHKCKLISLLSACFISSRGEDDVFNPFGGYKEIYKDILPDIPYVFLQHGIIQNNLSGWLAKPNKNIRGFITAAYPEYQSILNWHCGYDEQRVWLTGLPRFDRLFDGQGRYITLMPTWRKYLMGSLNAETGVWSVIRGFENSDYVMFYKKLLNDSRLLSAAEKYGYRIRFYPHPNILPYAGEFIQDDRVLVLDEKTTYREVYSTSAMVITDYSSAVFDFAYLRKPLIYTQFDSERFFSGEHTLKKGYFDYERDGFGEVESTLEGAIDRIIEYMENGCVMKDKYRKRCDEFFAYQDQNNCQRVYDKIIELTQPTDSVQGK